MAKLFSAQLLAVEPLSLRAAEFTFVGTLYVRGNDAWLEFDKSKGERLDIFDPSFVDRMWRQVPSRMGGDYLFSDPVELVGTLTVESGKLALSKVSHGKLFLDTENNLGRLDAYNF